MVRCSLLAKIFLCGIVALMLLVVTSGVIVDHICVPERPADGQDQLRSRMAAIATAVSSHIPPTPAQLQALSTLSACSLRFIPWQAVGEYPAALREQTPVFDSTARLIDGHHWARVDEGGKPVGAIELVMTGGDQGNHPVWGDHCRGFRLHAFWLWLIGLILLVLPPIWYWVLRPLRAMLVVANNLERGDWNTPIACQRTDEFGELERAFERIRVALHDQVARRERLFQDVSHEIKAPLARMTLALPLLKAQGAQSPFWEIFEKELMTADCMLSDVLALARENHIAQSRHVGVDLAQLAAELCEERAHVLAQRQLHLVQRLANAPVLGEAAMLRRAVRNLLDNALQYTHEGGTVRIESGTDGDRVFLRVVDDGPGIAEADLARIFEAFYRPDDVRITGSGGSGLGLAIVDAIARQHGGRATLRSSPHNETVAELLFPRATPSDVPA